MDNKNNEAVDGVVASEEISLEEQQAVLEKFDQESNTRNVTGFAKGFIKWYAIAMAVFHVYTSFFGLWATIRQRAMHLLFVMPLCYLMYPAKKGGARNNPSLLDWVFAALSFVCCGYIVVNYDAIFLRGGLPNQMDIIMGCLCALLVLEAVRRVVGTQLLIIAVIFLGYAYFGRYMPGILRHRGASIARMVDHMYMAPEGIFSTALGTSATFIVLFVIFAAFLQKSGMADLIRDLAMALAGGSVGGPAKVSVVTSAAFGTISGSAAANVVTTGAFTIPLMKSTGYEPEFAGAVEAVSSTGGQLMPPIMGSAAFIMADYLGIPYVTIIKAAMSTIRGLKGTEYSTVVTAICNGGVNTGLKVAALGEQWFTAPAPMLTGSYLSPQWSEKDASPYCGDSTITEVVGMGAFAGAAAPSVLRLRGGTYQDGINQSMDMRTLTVGLNSNYPIPLLDFTGPGLAIDIRKVINTGTPVVCHGGIISKDGGQIGAGIATFPMEVYVDAMYAFLKKYGIE